MSKSIHTWQVRFFVTSVLFSLMVKATGCRKAGALREFLIKALSFCCQYTESISFCVSRSISLPCVYAMPEHFASAALALTEV